MVNMHLCYQCLNNSNCKWFKELGTGEYKKDSPINIEYYSCDNYKSAIMSYAKKIEENLPLISPSKEDIEFLHKVMKEFKNKKSNK